jgi:hypothetical protein
MKPIRRDVVDPMVYRYFERVGVDVDATRTELAAAQDSHLAEVRGLRDQASQEAQTAQERLNRVKRDYLEGTITAEDWNGFRDDLTGELEAAQAQVQRFDDQLAAISRTGAARDLEQDVIEKLTAIRAAVAGEVTDAKAVEAARASIQRLFEGFTLAKPQMGQRMDSELAWTGSYVLEPILRDGVVPTSTPLYADENNFNVAVVTKYDTASQAIDAQRRGSRPVRAR